MTRVETSVLFNRRLEEIFAFIADVENNPAWQSGMQEAKITSEDQLVSDLLQPAGEIPRPACGIDL